MIERVGKEFPTLFICVRERVRPAPRPKAGWWCRGCLAYQKGLER